MQYRRQELSISHKSLGVMKRHPREPYRSTVTLIVEGRTYQADYSISRGVHPMITVSCEFGTRSTQLGGMPEEALARLILSQMVSRDIGSDKDGL